MIEMRVIGKRLEPIRAKACFTHFVSSAYLSMATLTGESIHTGLGSGSTMCSWSGASAVGLGTENRF